jgi:hypothetical protein
VLTWSLPIPRTRLRFERKVSGSQSLEREDEEARKGAYWSQRKDLWSVYKYPERHAGDMPGQRRLNRNGGYHFSNHHSRDNRIHG